jgi:hypothetical protein
LLKCSIIQPMSSSLVKSMRAMTTGLACGLFVAWVLLPFDASALQVSGLYSHRVKVANESDSERRRAFTEALAAVITKVTGDERWLLDPAIVAAVARAQSFVEAVSYESEAVVVPFVPANTALSAEIDYGSTAQLGPQRPVQTVQAPPAALTTTIEQRYINVNFSPALINELLVQANIPVWGSNRPSVLVWMVLQNEVGERTFLSNESNPEIVDIIQAFAKERGLPIIFPVFDFEDRRNLPLDVIWALDLEAMRSGSARYGADSILTGRLHFTAGGELVGLWQFDFQGDSERFDGFDSDLQSYLAKPLGRVTTQLANYFAIVPETSASQTIVLRVEGMQDLQDYSALINYVNSLGLVEAVTMGSIDGQRMDINVSLLGDTLQLSELIALDRDLLPIQRSDVASASLLHYRWTR